MLRPLIMERVIEFLTRTAGVHDFDSDVIVKENTESYGY